MTATTTSKTFAPRPRDIERSWYVVDADGAVLGRLASEVAKVLRGKHKPIFAPHVDTGDHVIVVNARGVRLTGGKEEKKVAYRHSQYPGGLTETRYARLLAERPAFAVEKAVKGMLPKNRLGRAMIRKLSIYEGAEHPHQAQQPKPLGLGEIPRWEGLPAPKPPKPPKAPKAPKAKPARDAAKPAAKTTAMRAGRATPPTAKRSTTGAAAKPSRKSTATSGRGGRIKKES